MELGRQRQTSGGVGRTAVQIPSAITATSSVDRIIMLFRLADGHAPCVFLFSSLIDVRFEKAGQFVEVRLRIDMSYDGDQCLGIDQLLEGDIL